MGETVKEAPNMAKEGAGACQNVRSFFPARSYFTPNQWFFLFIVLVVGLFLRWYSLDTKPMHHDESLHGMYGRYYFDWPEIQFYKYDPMLHGPLLYTSYRLIYNTLGLGEWPVRTAVAIPGTLLMFFPLLFWRYLTRAGLLAITAAVALSPTLIYWCRLIHHDIHVLFSMAVMLYGFTLARAPLRVFFFLLGVTLHWTTKENVFVTLALLLGYVVYEFLFRLVIGAKDNLQVPLQLLIKHLKIFGFWYLIILVGISLGLSGILTKESWRDGFWVALICLGLYWVYLAFFISEEALAPFPIIAHLRKYRFQVVISFLASALVFTYFFTAGFRYEDESYLKGILDALGRGSITYWLEQHSIERIKGEFLYHFYLNAWYELPFILAMIYQIYLFYKKGGPITKIVSALAWGIGLALGFWRYFEGTPAENWPIWKFFNLKDSFDIVALIVLSVHSVVVTSYHLYHKEKVLAFWGYFFFATFFGYSYVGEKVPWLGVYPFVNGIIYLTLYFEDYFKNSPPAWYANFSTERALHFIGNLLLILFVIFVIERIFILDPDKSSSEGMPSLILALLLAGLGIAGARLFKPHGPYIFSACLIILGTLLLWSSTGSYENIWFLVCGAVILAFAFFGSKLQMVESFNLKRALFLVFCLYSIRASILTNFTYSGEASEFISQVHTTKEFHDVALRVREEIISQSKGYKPLVLAEGEPVWPITWYLRDIPEYKFSSPKEQWKEFSYIFIDFKEDGSNIPPEGFQVRKLNLRGWWVPDQGQFTLKRFLNYSINHRPWSPVGYSYCTMLTNPNPSPPLPPAAPAPEAPPAPASSETPAAL